MNIQRVKSPLIGTTPSSSDFTSIKSRQLPTLSNIIQKCNKIANMLCSHFSPQNSNKDFQNLNKFGNVDPIEMLGAFVDCIYQMVTKYIDGNNQAHKIEELLQKQENLNRMLIKKELQFRQQQKSIYDQLCQHKSKTIKLNDYINKLNDQIKDKDLTILHVKNQLKACQKQRKFFDSDNIKMQFMLEQKLKSYVSKEVDKEASGNSRKIGVISLGHKRRKSAQYHKNRDRASSQLRKKQKDRSQIKKRNLLSAQGKFNSHR